MSNKFSRRERIRVQDYVAPDDAQTSAAPESAPIDRNKAQELMRLARSLGLYLGEHKVHADPAAAFFISERHRDPKQTGGNYLRYATLRECEDFLNKQERPKELDETRDPHMFHLVKAAQAVGFWIDPDGNGGYHILELDTRKLIKECANHWEAKDFLGRA